MLGSVCSFACALSCALTKAAQASIRNNARLSRFTGPPRKNRGGDLLGQRPARFGQALLCRGGLGRDLFPGFPDGGGGPLAGLGYLRRLVLDPAAAYLFLLFVDLGAGFAQLGLVLLSFFISGRQTLLGGLACAIGQMVALFEHLLERPKQHRLQIEVQQEQQAHRQDSFLQYSSQSVESLFHRKLCRERKNYPQKTGTTP